jgi:hypothetical protein
MRPAGKRGIPSGDRTAGVRADSPCGLSEGEGRISRLLKDPLSLRLLKMAQMPFDKLRAPSGVEGQ